jgi:hypothetical protein
MSGNKQNDSQLNPTILIKNAAAAAFSACVGETITMPLDTVKVRLQM